MIANLLEFLCDFPLCVLFDYWRFNYLRDFILLRILVIAFFQFPFFHSIDIFFNVIFSSFWTIDTYLIPWLRFLVRSLTISPVIVLSAAFLSFMFYLLGRCFVFTNSVHNYHDLVRNERINVGKLFDFAHFWTSFHRTRGRTDLKKSYPIIFIKIDSKELLQLSVI